jgi:hypothetical protein
MRVTRRTDRKVKIWLYADNKWAKIVTPKKRITDLDAGKEDIIDHKYAAIPVEGLDKLSHLNGQFKVWGNGSIPANPQLLEDEEIKVPIDGTEYKLNLEV